MEKIKNIFEAPEGYFDKLPQQIQKRIHEQKPRKNVWFSFFQPKYAFVVASVTLLLVFGGRYLMLNNKEANLTGFTEISNQQISQYLLQEGIQETELVEYYMLSSDDTENSESTAIEEILEDEIDTDEIEEML